MTLRLTNTLTGRKEEFQPLEPGRVGMYTCGPTVWNYAHVGNLRAMLLYDLLKRHLLFSGYQVTHVMNITDIDDRILHEAKHAGQTIREYTDRYTEAFFSDIAQLRFLAADVYPRATQHIPDIIEIVSRLVANGHAYAADGDVYFRVSSFASYGELSHIDRSGLKVGARVAQDRYDKESATDFALWKRSQPGDEALGASWSSPFGPGRPGWHIECSAMAMRYLGPTLDIHAGGIDLLFPHHENEIAQSEALTGKTFGRYWIHNEHLADALGQTMSKSTGNISTLRDVTEAGHDPVTVRYFLMAGAHYRTRITFDDAGLHSAAEQVRRLRDLDGRLRRTPPNPAAEDAALVRQAKDARHHYRAALDDDLNLPQAMGYVFELVREVNGQLDRDAVGPAAHRAVLEVLRDADFHLDVLTGGEVVLEEEVEKQIALREEARRRRDFATADRIRAELRDRGITLEDTAQGVRWRRITPGEAGG
jgi:cysteinyl-tRNA synthetase